MNLNNNHSNNNHNNNNNNNNNKNYNNNNNGDGSRVLYDMNTVKEISTSAVQAVMREFTSGIHQHNTDITHTMSQMNERYLRLEGLVNQRLEHIETEWKKFTHAQREVEEEEMKEVVWLRGEVGRKGEMVELL